MAQQVQLYDTTYKTFELSAREQVRLETYGDDIGKNSWLTTRRVDAHRAARAEPGSTRPGCRLWLGGGPDLVPRSHHRRARRRRRHQRPCESSRRQRGRERRRPRIARPLRASRRRRSRSRSTTRRSTRSSASTPSTICPTGRRASGLASAAQAGRQYPLHRPDRRHRLLSPARRSHSGPRSDSSSSRREREPSGASASPFDLVRCEDTTENVVAWRVAGTTLAPDTGSAHRR